MLRSSRQSEVVACWTEARLVLDSSGLNLESDGRPSCSAPHTASANRSTVSLSFRLDQGMSCPKARRRSTPMPSSSLPVRLFAGVTRLNTRPAPIVLHLPALPAKPPPVLQQRAWQRRPRMREALCFDFRHPVGEARKEYCSSPGRFKSSSSSRSELRIPIPRKHGLKQHT